MASSLIGLRFARSSAEFIGGLQGLIIRCELNIQTPVDDIHFMASNS